MPIPLPSSIRRTLRPLYHRANYIRQWWRLRRQWVKTRRGAGQTFFPAVNSFNFSTRAYLKSHSAPDTHPNYISIPDADYFDPPPPKTPGNNPLAHQVIPTNPPLFVARLERPSIYGDAGDVVTRDGVLLPDISFRYVVNLWQESHEHALLDRKELPPARSLPGSYALLTSRYSGTNYFHWLYNVLPRVALLERAGIRPDGLKLLINRPQYDVMYETLDVLGISRDQLAPMDEHDVVQPELVLVMPNFLRTGHRRRWILDWLREHFLRDVANGKPTRRLYLSRADATTRRVANEDEVMELLTPLGFEKIVVGDRSIFEQAALFTQAETVLAPHTAALANIVFCAPATRVVDFMAPDRLRTYMYELAAAMNLDYNYAFLDWNVTSNHLKTYTQETVIPLDRLQTMLRYARLE